MTTNTGKEYISKLVNGRYCLDVPAEYQNLVDFKQKITRTSLPSLVKLRNQILGYNPDLQHRPILDLIKREDVAKPSDRVYTFGAMADLHIGHIQEDRNALRKYVYEAVDHYDVRTFFIAGNWIDGDKFSNENYVTGLDNQVNTFLEVLPYIPGVKYYILDGDDHEGWFFQKQNVLPGQLAVDKQAAFGRDDLFYLGYMEATVTLNFPNGHNVKLGVMHGGGGTSSRNYGLAAQKAIDERYHPAEIPDILILGHYHKLLSLANYRGCHVFMPGCFTHQSNFTRKLGITGMIGGYVVTVGFNGEGRLRVQNTPLDYSGKGWSHDPEFDNHFNIRA